MKDLRFAFRSLARSPGFTAVAVLSLALGIGATTTVLCWTRHLVLRPFSGVAQQEELVVVVSNQGGGNVSVPEPATNRPQQGNPRPLRSLSLSLRHSP